MLEGGDFPIPGKRTPSRKEDLVMTPRINLDGMDPAAEAASVPAPTPLPAWGEGPAARQPTYGERQAIAMSWLFGALAAFLPLGGLALGAAVIFNVGFGG